MRGGWPACALIVWLAALPARAEREVAVALAWRSGDGCLDTAGLYAQVRSRRRPVAPDAGADAIISGRADVRPGGGWRVELIVADRRGAVLGRRSLEIAEEGCPPLVEHVALVVAMLVDSSVVERAAPPPVAPPPPRRDERWRGDGAAWFVGEAGRLPGRELGMGAAFGLASPGGWRAELSLFAFAEARAMDDSGETSLRWIGGGLFGCAPVGGRRSWHAHACAGFEASDMIAEGSGFARNQRDHKLLLDAVVRARIERRLLGPTFVALGLAGRLAAVRPRFGYEDEAGVFQPLYEPRAVAGSIEIGVGAHFP